MIAFKLYNQILNKKAKQEKRLTYLLLILAACLILLSGFQDPGF